MTSTTMHPVAAAFGDLRNQLRSSYLERDEAILAALLAVLCGEHIFMLGPPGTAKSKLVRAIVHSISNARYFETGLSKNKPAEAVLGPLDIVEFREKGNYFLKRAGYASAVEFAFLDEIGRMSPLLGDDLLMLLNERAYSEVNGGRSIHDAPMSTAFTASNSTLTDDNEDSAALWDRLLVRVVVDYLQDDDNFMKLLTDDLAEPTVSVDWADLQEVITKVIPSIKIDPTAVQAMASLRSEFRREHLYPSDRRWRQSMTLMKANAFLHGRDTVLEDDVAVLRFSLWDGIEQIDKVHRLCMAAANPFVEPLLQIGDKIAEVDNGITEREGAGSDGTDQASQRIHYGREAHKKLEIARNELDTLLMEAGTRAIPGFKKVSDEHVRVLRRVFMVCLEQTAEEVDVMMRSRLGAGDGGNK